MRQCYTKEGKAETPLTHPLCVPKHQTRASRIARPVGYCALRALMSGSTLWRINNDPLANDTVDLLPVGAGLDHFEFELVISGQRLARFRRQQLNPSLNIQRRMSGTVDIWIPHLDPGLCPTPANELFPLGPVIRFRFCNCAVAGRLQNCRILINRAYGNAGSLADKLASANDPFPLGLVIRFRFCNCAVAGRLQNCRILINRAYGDAGSLADKLVDARFAAPPVAAQ